jgi:hypothetical protein
MIKIRLLEPSYCIRTDIQTDMGKIIDAFRNFADAPDKNDTPNCIIVIREVSTYSCTSLHSYNSFSTI